MNRKKFIEKAIKVHGDKYDYSNVEYVNNKTKVCITCPIHGEFWQTPSKHLQGQNCPFCSKTRPKEWGEVYNLFIEKHKNEFDYSKVDFKNMNTKVCIIHNKCGNEFWQTPKNHIKGNGCPFCKNDKISNTMTKNNEDYIKECINMHSDKYDYSKTLYKSAKDKVCIICHKKDENGIEHGEFWQSASSHLMGCGCPKCGKQNTLNAKKKTYTTERFINESKKIHNDKWMYNNKTLYVSTKTPICITCPTHGEFWQMPYRHLEGCGCPKCGGTSKLTTKEFIQRAKEIHGDKYDYSKVEYSGMHNKVCVVCKEHGEFYTQPIDHLHGRGCPSCAHKISRSEQELYEYIEQHCGMEVRHNVRGVLSHNQELDIYIPQINIAIEYNGMRWHSELFKKDKNYHLNKLEECNRRGIKLINVFESEFINNKKLVLNKILYILGCSNLENKINARQCVIKEIDKETAKKFLKTNHIQGYVAATLYLGLFYKDELVSIMTMKKLNNKNKYEWELTRFANNNGYIVNGSFGKLFKYFTKKYKPNIVKSFADRRWTLNYKNNLYTKNGFELDKILKPDYRYTKEQGEYIHKFNFRKQTLHKRYGLPLSMTESEMTEQLGYYKIWDCGLFKYVWYNDN